MATTLPDFDTAHAAIAKQETSCTQLVSLFLDKIASENAATNSFVALCEERARQQASQIDKSVAERNVPRLAGMMLAVKDNISVENEQLSCASKILRDFRAVYSATAVDRLQKAGAIVIGKTNCDEFGMGSSNENSVFGPARNPHDLTRSTGGSSGGSAAAIASNLCNAALGSDTGGSVRQPAAFCGVVGVKPTYGRVSRFGLTAFASSLDCIGPITTDLRTAATMLEVMAGADNNDSTSVGREVPSFSNGLDKPINSLRIGLPTEYFQSGASTEILGAIDEVVRTLTSLRFEFEEVSLPHTEYGIATYYILSTAEASSNLARYDGVRYGFRAEDASKTNLADFYSMTRTMGFGEEVKRRIMLGTYVLSSGYYDRYFARAQAVRGLIRRDFDRAFEKVDVLLTPVTPTTAFGIGSLADDVLGMYQSDIYTVPASLAGLPAISVPVGRDSSGLPVGLQLIGRHFEESDLFGVANTILKHHTQEPNTR